MDGLVFNASLLRCVVRYCRGDMGGVFHVYDRHDGIQLVESATLVGGQRPSLLGLGLLLLTLERSMSAA